MKSKWGSKIKGYIKAKGTSSSAFNTNAKSPLNIFNKFTHRKDKFKATGLGDVQKGRGLSTFQKKMSVSNVVSTIAAPTFVVKSAAKLVAREGAKFSVAIFDNSPGFIKSWVRSFSGYGLAIHAAHERFDSLPEVVKIKARRSMFEIFLVIIVLALCGFGFGLYYALHKGSRTMLVRTNPNVATATTWVNNHSTYGSVGFGSFTWTVDTLQFSKFDKNLNSLKDFYINNFFGSNPKSTGDQFYFSGVHVPSMGVDYSSWLTQQIVDPSYDAPVEISKRYTPKLNEASNGNSKRAHFVKYSSQLAVSAIINDSVHSKNSADDSYRDALLSSLGQQNSSFALYTLSTFDKTNKIYHPEAIAFNSTETKGPEIQNEDVSILVTNSSPAERVQEAGFHVQILVTDSLEGKKVTDKTYRKNFGGIVCVNQDFSSGLPISDFSNRLEFSTK